MSRPEAASALGAAAHQDPGGGFHLLPAIERNPGIVRFAQTLTGRLTVIGVFSVLAWLTHKPAAIGGAALIVLFPAKRRLWVGLATLGMVFVSRRADDVLSLIGTQEQLGVLARNPLFKGAMLAAALLLTVAYVQLAKAHLGGLLLRRPVASFVAFFMAMLALVTLLPLSGVSRLIAWTLLAGVGSCLWYAAYSLRERADRRGKALIVDASAWRPFWGGTNTPFPKPASLLEKLEVRSAEEAAVWQLKALKLLAWALILAVLRAVVVTLATGSPVYPSAWLDGGIPCANELARGLGPSGLDVSTLNTAFAHSVAGVPDSAASNWAALALHLVVDLLDISIFGHLAVAGARMAGFKALRNTHRPLEARGIADFWNRYYFYFKELLVDLFFFPTYVRYFKRHPRLRLFFATIAAVAMGNFLYHYLGGLGPIAHRGLLGQLEARQAYGLYVLLLALGIGLSQLRRIGLAHEPRLLARIATVFGVLLFFGLLAIPGAAPAGTSVGDCWRFFLCLFPRV